MNEKTSNPSQHQYGVQEYLSLGYIYLIILGIVGDVIYYKFLGINILNYSTISDVLLAPVNTLVYDIRVFIMVVVIVGLGYLFYTKLAPWFHFNNKNKEWYRKIVRDMDKTDEKYAEIKNDKSISIILIFLPLMFVGLKIGAGASTQERIEKGEIKVSHTLVFSDNTSKRVKVIGQNSSYIFYVPEGQKEVSITPISGNIKEIKMIL